MERGIIAGLAVDPQLELLVAELSGHLRALLRDVLCGHLDPDLRGLADGILGQVTAQPPPPAAQAHVQAQAERAQLEQDTFF